MTDQTATHDWPAPLPPIGKADGTTLRKWIDGGLYYEHRLRVADVSAHRKAELYDACYQWLQRAMAGYDSGTGGASQWASIYWDPDDPDYISTPVFNEGTPARMNESTRIGRPNYRPVASAKGDNPSIQDREGAKRLQDALRHRLREMGWDQEKDLVYYHMPVYRGVWLKSEWEMVWDDVAMVPVEGAVKCPSPECGTTLASKSVPMQLAGQLPGLSGNVAEAIGQDAVEAKMCPGCGAPMLPFKPTMEEAGTQTDAVGRPLGQELPKGNWRLSVRNGDDVFPRNLGLDMRPGQVDEWVESHVEHLDWVANRWPEKAGLVRPESAAALAKYHPIAGAPEIYASVIDVKMFEASVRVKERHKKPWMERTIGQDGKIAFKRNKGRSSIMAGDVVLLDAPYMMPSLTQSGKEVERVILDYIPWEIREGGRRLEGLGLWDLMGPPQDVINTIWSQVGAVRERTAVPIYVATRTSNFELSALRGGVPGRLGEFDPDPNAPALRPELINNETIDHGVYQEMDRAIAALHDRYSGNARVEGGAPPPGVDAAQAIRELKEAAGEKRDGRIRRIRTGFKRVFDHGGRLMQALYLEPRPIKYEDEDSEERWTHLQGLDLGTDVEIDVEPEEVDSDEKRLAVKDLMGTGVINLADPTTTKAQKRRVAKYIAPDAKDLYEDEDLQEKSAQREWIKFKKEQRIPIVDPELDDHEEHYKDHGRKAHSEWFRHHEDVADWDGALKVLGSTWDMTRQSVASMLLPPPPPPPMVDAAGAPIPGPPPVPWAGPPAGCIQDFMLGMWQQQLLEAQFPPPPAVPPVPGVEDPQAAAQLASLKIVLDWRAHMAAHRLEAEIKQMRATMQPTLAAPGADATAAGNQPTAGAPPDQQQAPGAASSMLPVAAGVQ